MTSKKAEDVAAMSQRQHNSRPPSTRSSFQPEQMDEVGKTKTPSPSLKRPQGNNPDEWRAYWQAQGQAWRTEPEISLQRQDELKKCRETPVNPEKGIYPFKGMKLDRADVEWLLATHENGRGPVVWSDEKQRDRQGLDLRGADLRGDGNTAINLQHLPLTRLRGGLTLEESFGVSGELYIKAQIQLKGANLREAQLEGANLGRAQLEGTDLREAQLKGANLKGAQLERADLRKAQLEGAFLSEAQLERAALTGAQLERANLLQAQLKGAFLLRAQLEGANLREAQLKGANLREAQLKGANLREAQLEGVDLREAQLEEVDLREAQLERTLLRGAQLERANLTGARLEGADLRGAQLEGADLRGVILSREDGIGPFLGDVQWGATNLAVVDWSQVVRLSEEDIASQKHANGVKKTKDTRLEEFQEATRANRQLAVALLGQGLNEDAVRFAYRANVCQRKVLWYQTIMKPKRQKEREWYKLTRSRLSLLLQRGQQFGAFLFSFFLDLLAGHGYKPERTLGWYLLVVFGFALSYAHFGGLPFLPDALVYSLTSFHGRGFLPNLDGQTATLHHPLVVMAAFEAVVGLLVEISFIATFTQRYFGK